MSSIKTYLTCDPALGAPNPRVVDMFAAEKGFDFSETIEVDLGGGENRRGEYLERNPAGQVPCVELADGTIIAETIAIYVTRARNPISCVVTRTFPYEFVVCY